MTEQYTDFKPGELTPWQELSRGLKTLEGSVASLAIEMDNRCRNLEGSVEFLQSLALPGKLKDLDERILLSVHRDQQLTATIEGVDAHLEKMEQEQWLLWESLRNQITVMGNFKAQLKKVEAFHVDFQKQLGELHSTFQDSIDALDAKFDEYMQMVRKTSYNMIAQGTRITQLETLAGQQRTMIETALRALWDHWGSDATHPFMKKDFTHVSDLPEVPE